VAQLTNYETMRPQLKTGDLLQWRGGYPFSKIIRRGTGQYYNHSSFLIRLPSYSDHVYSIEALENGLFLYRLSTLLQKYDGYIDVFPLKKEYYPAARGAAGWLLDRQGTAYDWSGCLSNRARLYRRFGLDDYADKIIEAANEVQLYCSESVFLAFRDGPQQFAVEDTIEHLQNKERVPVPGNEMLDMMRLWETVKTVRGHWRGINLAGRVEK
jgi:hypothetical protein